MLCYLLQQLKKKNLSLPSSLQVLMGTSGVCKNRLVMVRATKPSQLLPAVPHTSTHRGKSNRGLCQQNVNLCRPWGTRQLQNSNSKKKPLFQMFSAVAGGAHKNRTSRSLPRPRAKYSAWNKRTRWMWIRKGEFWFYSCSTVSITVYYCLHLDLANSTCRK